MAGGICQSRKDERGKEEGLKNRLIRKVMVGGPFAEVGDVKGESFFELGDVRRECV
jgi:hypothetical protein